MKPSVKPSNPFFSSGPCCKRPGWSLEALEDACLGRSHRSKTGKEKIAEVIRRSKQILKIPHDYILGIVPGSDTGAIEMALWCMLGERGVDVLSWESFGQEWAKDIVRELALKDVREYHADYGQLPDLDAVDTDRDVVFTWNGTTSGVCVPHARWIKDKRKGLTFCDATSALYAMEVPWHKLDVTTYSWQKALGGEAAHGILVLSPRAVKRLESFEPEGRPLPKIFRLTKNRKLIDGIFEGATINTPSMLCIEDALDGLRWSQKIGGIDMLIHRSRENLKTITEWVKATDWIDFLATAPQSRSNTSICLKINAPWYTALNESRQKIMAGNLVKLLENEGVAFDIGSYRDAPPGLRIWGGPTVENSNIKTLLPWLDWAYETIREDLHE